MVFKERPVDLDVARFLEQERAAVEAVGLSIELRDDFDELRSNCEGSGGKGKLSEPFHPAFMDVTAANGFWICGCTKKGKVRHVQAVRLDSLGQTSAGEFWTRNLRRIHDVQVGTNHCPAAYQMTGRVAYHGEMWIAPKRRRRGLAARLARIAQAVAYLRWKPDFMYGFVSNRLVQSGFPAQEGYQNMQPNAIDWIDVPNDINRDDWMVWNSRQDQEWLFRQPPGMFSRQT